LVLPDVGEIRAIRKSLGLTQSDLSKLTGVSRSSVSKLENNEIDLAYSKIKRIFDVLEIQRSKTRSGVIDSVTLGNIHSVPYADLDANMLMNDVFVMIHRTGFSQFVISDSGRIVGSITDRKAFGARVLGGDDVKDHVVGDYMGDPFPVLSVNALVINALPLLISYQAVLTMEKDNVVGIVTNNDVGKLFI
jgi:predicted transcriptional regulator